LYSNLFGNECVGFEAYGNGGACVFSFFLALNVLNLLGDSEMKFYFTVIYTFFEVIEN